MAPQLEQSAANTVAKGQSRSCTATFTRATRPGNLIIVVCVGAGTLPSNLAGPSGFTLVQSRGLRDVQMSVWYRQASPSITSVSVTTLDADKSLMVRALEYSGMAQANVLDRLVVNAGESYLPYTGQTGTTSQADELVLNFVANQYASTTQFGFGGGLVRLYENVSPQGWSRGSNHDWERARLTVHQGVAVGVGNFSMRSLLSAARRWLTIMVTFRGGSSGPARFSARDSTNVLTQGGTGGLTVFGPLTATLRTGPTTPMVRTGAGRARVGPFDYQYRLGGWSGLLIGTDTPYYIDSHEGLEGWQLRTSDDELPRGDGSLRGIDLQAARQVLFKLKVSGTHHEVEEAMDILYRALVPQRDQDWELIWRHPGRPLRMMHVRPTDLSRELSYEQTVLNDQAFALIASDPRHYSASIRLATVDNTPAGGQLIPTGVINEGNGFAYPLIRIDGPTSGEPVSRIELVNSTLDTTFVVEAVLPKGSVMVGDMEARATGAARSVVTIDGQSKYGAWQHPRETMRLAPGSNDLTLETVPAGAPVSVHLEYRDTWSG